MILCSTCERTNAPRARFCAGCGAALRTLSGDEVAPQALAETASIRGSIGGGSGIENSGGAGGRVENAVGAGLTRTLELNPASDGLQGEGPAAGGDASSGPAQEPAGPAQGPAQRLPAVAAADEDAERDVALPLVLECNWHRLLVVGHGTTFQLRLSNRGSQPCASVRVELRSRALAEVVEWRHRGLKPGQSVDALLEVDALKSGASVLQVSVSYETPVERVRLEGSTSMTVHVAPSESNITVSVGNIFSELKDGAGTGAELNIETLVDIGKIKTVNDLISLVLPDRFERIPLVREVFGFGTGRDLPDRVDSLRQKIPARYVSHVKQACRMELIPTSGGSSDGGEEPSILLVAGEKFRLGRQRGEVDYLAWFWPRNVRNDERTMRLSKGAHLSLRLSGGVVYLEDTHSSNGSTFRGTRVPRPCEMGSDLAGLPSSADEGRLRLDARGVAVLAGEYELELVPLASSLRGPLSIVNETVWPGACSERTQEPPFGCVRLDPVNSAVALQRSVWVLSDLSFGKAQTNGLVFADAQTPELQGRFIYYRSQFWVETIAENNGVQVDGMAMVPGDLIPLVERQVLRIGGREYRTHFPEPVCER